MDVAKNVERRIRGAKESDRKSSDVSKRMFLHLKHIEEKFRPLSSVERDMFISGWTLGIVDSIVRRK
jgi:hypothetical protein